MKIRILISIFSPSCRSSLYSLFAELRANCWLHAQSEFQAASGLCRKQTCSYYIWVHPALPPARNKVREGWNTFIKTFKLHALMNACGALWAGVPMERSLNSRPQQAIENGRQTFCRSHATALRLQSGAKGETRVHAMPCGELQRLTKLLPTRAGSKVKVVFWQNRRYCGSHANLCSSSLAQSFLFVFSLGPLRPDSFQHAAPALWMM